MFHFHGILEITPSGGGPELPAASKSSRRTRHKFDLRYFITGHPCSQEAESNLCMDPSRFVPFMHRNQTNERTTRMAGGNSRREV